jgi:acetyl esterase/lipase
MGPHHGQRAPAKRVPATFWLAIAVTAILALSTTRPIRSAPLEAYGRLPSLEDVALSPDGTRLAFVRTVENSRLLGVVALADQRLLGGSKLGETKLRDLAWADNDHLLITTAATGRPFGLSGENQEWHLLTVYDLRTRKAKSYPELLPDLQMLNVIAGEVMVRHIDNDTVLFIPGLYAQDRTMLALFRVDLRTGRESLVRKGTEATRGWLVNEAGEVVAEDDYYERDQRWQMKIRHDNRLVDAEPSHEPIDIPEMLGFGPLADSVLIATKQDGDPVWKLLSLKDGKLGPPLEEGQNLNAPFEDPVTHRMIGGIHIEDEAKYVFFDPEMQSRWRSILNAFEGERVRLVSTSNDMTQFIVSVDGPNGYRYQRVDMRTLHSFPIGNVYEGITQPLEVRRISYNAADGLKIPGYLTLPAGRPPTKLPLIVFPHGGPAARDSAEFDWWAQAMASQGYAVLQPNFRGSTLTWSFMSAGFGEWGRKMQTDLSDGVRYLVEQGIADPARVCIVGASYGGYAALAGVTLDPGVYRCAVSVAGISDLKRFLLWVNARDTYGDHTAQRWWDRFMGISSYKDPQVDAISPIRHVDAITVPVLLIHGRDDTTVPFEQSDVMLSAMKKANKKVELVAMKKEDHYLSRSETRLQMLQSLVAFLKTHNPPD